MLETETDIASLDATVDRKTGYPNLRMRRLRQHPALRALVREHHLQVSDLVLPLFIKAGQNIKNPLDALPGHYQLSVDCLAAEIQSIVALNIPAVLLFGIPSYKDAMGSAALQDNGVVQQAIRKIKMLSAKTLVIADLCCCEYTDHGHCGALLNNTGEVDNDQTLKLLAKQAVSLAAAGADVIAPSGMMDGMVQAVRRALDQAGYQNVAILSYAVKYASAFYGPFREAAEGAPKFGDRSSYQMDPANALRSLREAELDIQEGADILMVKPASNYLDVIYRIKQKFPSVPLAAYHVSGEFALIKAAAEKGWVDEQQAMCESLLAIKRAGADFIITYYAKDLAALLR
ncbi:MAG: porphobilinogen synthase [Gammaproteobacteria bacterium]|nr:porphobilinogen synthase [Gammaproteobacteria bacterium]